MVGIEVRNQLEPSIQGYNLSFNVLLEDAVLFT